jgi:galactokinase
MSESGNLRQAFKNIFNDDPVFVVRAPGRVNLIGEHTDYNEGFVLPMAIDRAIWIALRPRPDSLVRVHALDLNLSATFDANFPKKGNGWAEYLKGTAYELQNAGFKLKGWEGVLSGDIPRGAGLSSSAAVELAAARAFAAVSGFEWNAARLAKIAQRAENDWVGVNCGIMDQMASAVSRAGRALFLDCRTLEVQHIPIPSGVSIFVLDTSTRRGLVNSAYNERRGQCEQAAKWFGVKALRDVSVETLQKTQNAKREDLNEVVLRRARHVITENARVLEAIQAMKSNDLVTLGRLFNESHASLRNDFEVTNDALDQIVECALEQPGCYGARMTGAGFGGCAVALVREEEAEAFAEAVSTAYRQRSGLEAGVYVCKASEGANLVE